MVSLPPPPPPGQSDHHLLSSHHHHQHHQHHQHHPLDGFYPPHAPPPQFDAPSPFNNDFSNPNAINVRSVVEDFTSSSFTYTTHMNHYASQSDSAGHVQQPMHNRPLLPHQQQQQNQQNRSNDEW
eukprot:GDKJ01005182.1.p1 GENE.GDKJ01005182.1~~GDKJ01005182.1.p1  ORF type:complete len:125 (+),score=47.75 GDKJ01005182.1:1-375(+)